MDLVVTAAREWVGTPWHHNQRCKGVGVDCVQFIAAIAHDVGVDIGRIENYYRTPEGNSLIASMQSLEGLREVSVIEPGVILVFQIGGVPHHLGIATENGMIHADSKVKRVVEISNLGFWKRLLVATFAINIQG